MMGEAPMLFQIENSSPAFGMVARPTPTNPKTPLYLLACVPTKYDDIVASIATPFVVILIVLPL
jgi:hypothetical protein